MVEFRMVGLGLHRGFCRHIGDYGGGRESWVGSEKDGICGCGGGPCEPSDQKANKSNEQQRHMRKVVFRVMIPSPKGLRCQSLSPIRQIRRRHSVLIPSRNPVSRLEQYQNVCSRI